MIKAGDIYYFASFCYHFLGRCFQVASEQWLVVENVMCSCAYLQACYKQGPAGNTCSAVIDNSSATGKAGSKEQAKKHTNGEFFKCYTVINIFVKQFKVNQYMCWLEIKYK